MIGLGFDEMELNRFEAIIMTKNTTFINLVEKIGFRNEGLLAEYERWGNNGFVDLCIFTMINKAGNAP